MKTLSSKTIAIASTATVLAGLLGVYVWHEENRPKVLEIYIFSLKSGNSIFIRTPDDMRYLINGGANSEIIRHITKILPFYSRKIDGIFATDVDPKNVGGLISIIERYGTEKVYLPSENIYSLGLAPKQDDAYKVLLDTIESNNVKTEKLSAGMSVELGSSTTMEILFPFEVSSTTATKSVDKESTINFEYSKASSPELIMRIVYKSLLHKNNNFSAILLNSAPKKIQKSIKIEKSDVLIVTNGASNEQLDQKVADKISPKYVIYSKSETVSSKLSTKSTSNSKSASKINLLFAKILPQNKFNTKEGTVKLIVDEKNIDLIQDKE